MTEIFHALSAEQASLFEASPNPTLVLDASYRIRYVNSAAAQLGGVSADALAGLLIWERYPELEHSIFHQAYAAVLREGASRQFEEYRPAVDSWVSVYAYPAEGGVVAVLEDITERRRAERALAESERALTRAQEVAGIGSWVWPLNGDTQWSLQTFRILGLAPTTFSPSLELIRSRIHDEADRGQWDLAIHQLLDGHDLAMELAVRRFDDHLATLRILGRPARNAGGVVTHVFGTMEDVTERHRAAEYLRQSEETLRIAQEAANIGSFERDLRTRVTRWSPQLMRIIGIDPATYDATRNSDNPRMEFIHPADRDAFRAAFARVLETGKHFTLRSRFLRPDGEVRHMLTSALLVRAPNGEPVRVVGTALDITEQVHAEEERRRVEAQIQQAQKLESLGVLAGGIAHDFNNLLVGILGNASLALLDMSPQTEIRRSVEAIEQAAQRAADLTRQLLAYAGEGRVIVESVDVASLVGEMASLLRTTVSKHTQIQLDLTPDLPRIQVDATQFRQIVMNLVTNASDAVGERRGMIHIRVGAEILTADRLNGCVPGTSASPGPHVFLEVSDDGKGMDAATRARIFDPFFSTRFTGRGLGLAATLGIVRGHRGAIDVRSTVGEGTAFRLFFPATGQPARTATSLRDNEWRASGHVLIVDDEDSVRAVTGALLRRRGFTVSEARDGVGALNLSRADPDGFALVLLDLTMPGMSGEAAFGALRELRPDVPVVLMSGYNEQEVTRIFEGRGLAGFLQKPFRADELYSTVARALHIEQGATTLRST